MVRADAAPPDALRLTEWTSCGGCAAKWGAALLRDLVADFPPSTDPSLMIGLAPFDDAAIYKVSDDVAIVSTTDFFPPLVDDPSDFGTIAAANACSDVFAMGGRVVMAINVAAFPEHFPREAIAAIFEAGATVVAEAGGAVAGGHTIRNPEPIYGLAVQGVVHPDRVFRKGGGRPGDVLMLSKPLGTGLALAAGTPEQKAAAIAGMRTLNRAASETLQALRRCRPRRHRRHRLRARRARLGDGAAQRCARRRRHPSRSSAYPGAVEAAVAGIRTGGDPRNRDYLAGHLDSTCRIPGRRRCASIRRRQAGCWPPSNPTSPASWWPPVGGGWASSRPARPVSSSSSCRPTAPEPRYRRRHDRPRQGSDPQGRAAAVGRGPRDRRRHRRGRSRRMGGTADGGCRDPAARQAGARRPRLQDAHRATSASACSTASPAGA